MAVPRRDRETPYLVRELVRCGKPNCRCTRGLRHGPYWYLRYEEWDAEAHVDRYRREYVPKRERHGCAGGYGAIVQTLPWSSHGPPASLRWSSQDLVDTPSPRFLGRFELLWAHAA